MRQPWGLTGPEFTVLYIVSFLVALGIVFGVQAMLPRTGPQLAGADVRLGIYQAAYVAGGPLRVVDTAITALALREQILVARGRRLTAAAGAAPSGPVETALYEAVQSTSSRAAVRSRLRDHPTITALAEQVREQGLLLSDGRVLLWRLVLIVPIGVWFVGLVRAINGAGLGRPIGNLTTLLQLSAVATVFIVLARIRARHRPSAAGKLAVRQFHEQHRAGTGRDAVWEPQAVGVAVLGLTALTDPQLRMALVGSGRGGGANSGGDSGGGGGCGGDGGCGG